MNKKNLILTGLGLYILGYNIYYNDESRSIPQPVNLEIPNLEIPNVDVKYTKPCDCNCKVEGWETDFTDLEINNEFIINDFIESVNKFKLQVIPSPFSITNGVRIKQTNCGKKTNNNNRELEVNNAFLILFNNDNLNNDNSYGVKKLCYEFCLLGGKNYLLITSGNNFSLEDINNYPEIPFEGCKINILDQGNGSKKVIIESDNCLDVVAVYGQELFINNLKYCLDKCDQ